MCEVLCALLLTFGMPAFAEEIHAFEVDASNPIEAIHAFALQADVQMLASGQGLQGKRLNSLSGSYSTDDALKRLLDGSGLNHRYVGDRAVALVVKHGERESPRRVALAGGVRPPPAASRPSRATSSAPAAGRVVLAEDPSAGFSLETITVTARRRTENLQDTPISIAAFSGNLLEDRQIFRTEDLDQITPNLQFATVAPLSGNNSAAQLFIRGIGQTDATAGVDPGVGLYIDEVYMGSAVGGAMDLRDIDKVQVLRGPQGTLFGRNTIGGALLLTTVEPGDVFAGSARIGAGTDHLIDGFVAVDAPVSDTLKTRWSFGSRMRDGYVTRTVDGVDLGDVDNYAVTAKALWRPSAAWRVSFKADYNQADEHGTPLVFAAMNESSSFPRSVSLDAGCPGMTGIAAAVPAIDDPRCANDFWNDGPAVANGTLPLESTLQNWGAAVTAEWRLTGAWSLKSITAYRELNWTGNRDADNTPFPILHTQYRSNGDQFSQELQAQLNARRLNGVAGLYYFDQTVDDRLRVTLSPPSAPTGTQDSNDNLIENRNWAVFTQWTWQASDALSLTGGVRYTSETKASTPFQFNYDHPEVLFVPHRRFEKEFSRTTGSAAIQYRWNAALMTYLSWTQGFKGGGFNSRFNSVVPTGEPPSFDPEQAESRELGVKLSLADALRLNVSVFATDYDDLQLTYRIGLAPYLFNAGKATIEGAELELQYVPVHQLIVEGGVGYLDARIDEVSTIAGATTAVTTGSKLPYTPQWQGNVAIAYSFDMGASLSVTPRVEFAYTDAQFFDAGNTAEIGQTHSVALTSLGVTLERLTSNWKLALGISNLTDEIFPIAGNSSLTTGTGYAEIAYSRGREGFVNFSKSF